jgi:hypothetical protein
MQKTLSEVAGVYRPVWMNSFINYVQGAKQMMYKPFDPGIGHLNGSTSFM